MDIGEEKFWSWHAREREGLASVKSRPRSGFVGRGGALGVNFVSLEYESQPQIIKATFSRKTRICSSRVTKLTAVFYSKDDICRDFPRTSS